jgi:anti-sigma B factor antagonist
MLRVSVVFISGEIDLASAPGLERELRAAETDAGRELVVDLSGVTFMDSTGLHVLLDAQERATHRGYMLRFQDVPAQTQRLLDLAGAFYGYGAVATAPAV